MRVAYANLKVDASPVNLNHDTFAAEGCNSS